jgi:hypothetical protein
MNRVLQTRRRKNASLYKGAYLRVWFKKDISHREHRGHREDLNDYKIRS